ncbi:MAG TPA: hypothetical protein VIU44_15835 [Gaiellaceae bacterium]
MPLPDENRRAMNEDRRRVFGSSRAIAFLCECRDPECRAAVVLTPGQFDGVVAAQEVLLHAGHEAAPTPGPLPSELKSR